MTVSMTRVEQQKSINTSKPHAVSRNARVGIFAPASPAEEERVQRGLMELRNLGFSPVDSFAREPQAYFSASAGGRLGHFQTLLQDPRLEALIALRGGYGSNYMLESIWSIPSLEPKCILGYSDITSLQILLWQKFHWAGFYGPMVAAGFDAGANAAKGYDRGSLEAALFGAENGWKVGLGGETMAPGFAEGIVLGGCLTLVETSLGTPWELDTMGCILLLEDRGMKPWQIDRALMHLIQAGKLCGVRGVVLGEFPDCDPPVAGSPDARAVCERILKPVGVPVVYGAAVGHTPRPMLTIPLGIRAKLTADAAGSLEFLETAVTT